MVFDILIAYIYIQLYFSYAREDLFALLRLSNMANRRN